MWPIWLFRARHQQAPTKEAHEPFVEINKLLLSLCFSLKTQCCNQQQMPLPKSQMENHVKEKRSKQFSYQEKHKNTKLLN